MFVIECGVCFDDVLVVVRYAATPCVRHCRVRICGFLSGGGSMLMYSMVNTRNVIARIRKYLTLISTIF